MITSQKILLSRIVNYASTSAKTEYLHTLTIAYLGIIIIWKFLYQVREWTVLLIGNRPICYSIYKRIQISTSRMTCKCNLPIIVTTTRHTRAFGLAWRWDQYLVNICDESKQRADRMPNVRYRRRFHSTRPKYRVKLINWHCQKILIDSGMNSYICWYRILQRKSIVMCMSRTYYCNWIFNEFAFIRLQIY